MKQLLLSILLCVNLIVLGETPTIIFEANKNQWPEQVKFQADIPGGKLFLEQNTFTYLYAENIDLHSESERTINQKFHSFKVHFENSNSDAKVSGSGQYSWHRNYYIGNDPKKWADHVPLYEQVYYKDLYPNIDLKAYNTENNFKYDIIVHAGGDPNSIKLNYTGTDGLRLENGHLFIKTSVYDLIEQKPFAYQEINGIKREIACSYILQNHNLSFAIGNYDHSLPLIIDPILIASTYSGSTTDNRGFTSTYDAAGNIYMAGTASGIGYPVTLGGYSGGTETDITFTKFNPTGTTILFSTYYGGANSEQPHSLIVNKNNEFYILGRTNSTNFPTTAGAWDQTQNGGYDIVVGRFSSTGGLLASTYIGGSSDDGVNVSTGVGYSDLKMSWGDDARSEIALDNNSNVYVASNTQSSNFPTTAGAYQATLNGVQDGVVFKMNTNLSLSFSSYLGGSNYDAAYGIKTDNSNKIFVTGGTESIDFPIPVAGVIHPTFGGIADGFIAVLDPSLSGSAQLLRSTYLGTVAYDQSMFIEIDGSGDLYVYGQTAGSYPVSTGTPSNGMFIHKLTGNLQTSVFSTVIGNGSTGVPLSPTAFLVDSCQTIYFSGWGRCAGTGGQWTAPYQSSTTGLPVTNQSTTDGCDFYIAVLAPDAKALWYGTFFGQNSLSPDHVDGGTCRFDPDGIVYHAACVSFSGTQFPTTPNAYSNTNNALCNEAVFKMDLSHQPHAVISPIITPTTGCVPFNIALNISGSTATDLVTDFGDGSPIDTSKAPSHTYFIPGNWVITVYAIDSVGVCGLVDTAQIVITVGASPALTFTTTSASSCSASDGKITVSALGGLSPYSYSWNNGGTTSMISGLAAGVYTVTVNDSVGCWIKKTDTVTCPTGIHDPVQTDFTFYPNPSSGIIYISCHSNTIEIVLTDVLGRKIYFSQNLVINQNTSINLSSAPAGIYFLQVKTPNGNTVKKIIKE